ncbi:MAG: glycosyltransferase, partial [Helicobacteraceae bacterium]|nr:glycosyltransferase [Helicobacteraceae bacterium]
MSKRLVIFASSLNRGGAERQLVALAKELKKRGQEVAVAIYYDKSEFDRELIDAGVAIYYLRKKLGVWRLPFALIRLAKMLRSLKPSAIYSFMDSPNIFVALLKPFLRGAKIVWGIRSTVNNEYGFLNALGAKLETLFSRFPDLIVANSSAGRELCIKKGFPKDKIVVVENGIDTERFNYDPKGAKRVR